MNNKFIIILANILGITSTFLCASMISEIYHKVDGMEGQKLASLIFFIVAIVTNYMVDKLMLDELMAKIKETLNGGFNK